MNKVQVIAHRGASAIRPENTMSAFKKAIEMGANAIETDVQMTKDGHLILIHDEQLSRTTNGVGWVKDYTLKEIKKLDAGYWFSPEYANETIPTIDELFILIYNTNLWVNIEIKMGFIMYPGIEQRLVDKIKEYGLEGRVIISSFNHYSIKMVSTISPELNTAILYSIGLYEPWNYALNIGARYLHPNKNVVYKELVDAAHQYGMKVYPYTVDDEREMRYLIEMGVDGIITNVPDRLITVINKLRK